MAPAFLLLLLLLLWLQGPVSGERTRGQESWLGGGGGGGAGREWPFPRPSPLSCFVGLEEEKDGAGLEAPDQRTVRRLHPYIWPQAKLPQASQTKIKLQTLSGWAPSSARPAQDL